LQHVDPLAYNNDITAKYFNQSNEKKLDKKFLTGKITLYEFSNHKEFVSMVFCTLFFKTFWRYALNSANHNVQNT